MSAELGDSDELLAAAHQPPNEGTPFDVRDGRVL